MTAGLAERLLGGERRVGKELDVVLDGILRSLNHRCEESASASIKTLFRRM